MSHLYRDTGVVLRTYKLGEADRIVVLLTEENGKVRAVAKGVRKTTSKFGARLEPMSHVRLLLYRGRELDIVSQAESVEPLSPLLATLDRASQALAVLEAADQLALEREPNPRLYRMLVGVLSGTPNTGAKPAPITDPEKLQEALKASYVDLQKAITGLSDNDLQAPVKLFGRDMTKQGALMLILNDQHEHLGQSIAYARSNGVVPPWSK